MDNQEIVQKRNLVKSKIKKDNYDLEKVFLKNDNDTSVYEFKS